MKLLHLDSSALGAASVTRHLPPKSSRANVRCIRTSASLNGTWRPTGAASDRHSYGSPLRGSQ